VDGVDTVRVVIRVDAGAVLRAGIAFFESGAIGADVVAAFLA